MRKLLCVVLLVECCFGWVSYDGRLSRSKTITGKNMNETFFNTLDNYQVNAVPVTEAQYPWVARVVHSRQGNVPHMCTAVCVSERIFITAARCIYSLKLSFTTVLYQGTRCPALAFVLPWNSTRQLFDDIGFIVTRRGHQAPWSTVSLFDAVNRTDDWFQWFADLNFASSSTKFKVIGYAVPKASRKHISPTTTYNLTELEVFVDINLCYSILSFNHKLNGFHVPCYHSCSLATFQSGKPSECKSYHGVEGGAVIDTSTGKLLGLATWGPVFFKYELPVGIAVPNSENFYNNYGCAVKVRNYNGYDTDFSYQSLCG